MSIRDRSPDAAPGAGRTPVVPGYVLEELLGRGGSGEVWRARPRGGGERVAVKVLSARDPDRQGREAALLGELDHPHLVRLHDVVHRPVRDGTQVALVLDLLAGGSLAALLARRGRLRPGEVVTAIAPVAAALAHVHDRGIVHGDLSPGNIVFTAEGRPVLTDLGVGRVLGEAGSGEVTPPYVDPVVARGGAAGPASDVFGVAAAAFHALTGIPPWNAAGAADTLVVAAAGQVPDLGLLAPGAPPALVEVVERGLSPHPHLRGSAAEFALDLRHARRPERIGMPAPGVDDHALGRTGQVPRTELTHQVRRPAGAHAAPTGGGRRTGWARRIAERAPAGPGSWGVLLRRGAGVTAVAAAVLGSVWLGVQWGSAGESPPVPAARTGAVQTPAATQSGPPPSGSVPSGSSSAGSSSAGSSADHAPAAAPGSPSPGSSSPAAGPTAAAADSTELPGGPTGWSEVLTELYDRRATAFAAGSPEHLAGVFTAASPLGAGDAGRIADLVQDGSRLVGFAPEVVGVDGVTPVGDGAVRLELTDRVPPYAVVDATGGRQEVGGRDAARVVMTLRPTTAGWRIDTAELVP